jgi:hypothetical protein
MSVLSLDLFNFVDIIVPRYTQQQLLIRSCGNTGIICKKPKMLAISISADAIVLLDTKIALFFSADSTYDLVLLI